MRAIEGAEATRGGGLPRLRGRLRRCPRLRLLGRASRAAGQDRARRAQHADRHPCQRSRLRRLPGRQLQAVLGARGDGHGPDRAGAMAHTGTRSSPPPSSPAPAALSWPSRPCSPIPATSRSRSTPTPTRGRTHSPSGHSAGSLAISLAFLTVVPPSWRRPTAVAGIVFTLYISFGVLLLNYHYPSDVLGGWLLAAGWWFALLAVSERWPAKAG